MNDQSKGINTFQRYLSVWVLLCIQVSVRAAVDDRSTSQVYQETVRFLRVGQLRGLIGRLNGFALRQNCLFKPQIPVQSYCFYGSICCCIIACCPSQSHYHHH